MPNTNRLAERFEEHRPRLRAVAYRMLGSAGEAEDTVQDAWLRLARSEAGAIDNLGGWLTTVVSRIALDRLRTRQRRKEVPGGVEPDMISADGGDPEEEAVLGDVVGMAMLMVLDALQPAERVAFVLHDTFGVPFADVGRVLHRSPNAAKQLASRARRKVRGSDPAERDPAREREIVGAFLGAARNGDLAGLLAVLDPDVVLMADPAAVVMGSPEELRGADDVAALFNGRAQGALTVLVDGAAGVAWIVGGKPKVVWDITVIAGRIAHIDMLADVGHLRELDLMEDA